MAEEVFGLDVVADDGERGQIIGAAGLLDDGVGVLKHLVDGHGVHLAAVVVAGFDGGLEVAAGRLGGEVVGDDEAGLALHLDPRDVGHCDPNRTAVDGETDVGRVGVAGCDGDDGSLPGAVQGLGGPAVGYGEVFIHGNRLVHFGCGRNMEIAAERVRRPRVGRVQVPVDASRSCAGIPSIAL